MDDLFLEREQMQILDFATDKRDQWEKDHRLYSVLFELTPKCNFNCVHCYLHDHHISEELSLEDVLRIIDLLYEKEVLFLTFTGGDIFTRKDFLEIYLHAKRKGFIIELYTNGALIDDSIISVFKEYPPLLVDISLYGSCEETYKRVTGVSGAFYRVMSNIQKLLEAGIRVSLKVPVLNLYFNELPRMKMIAEEFGIPFRTGFEVFPTIDNDVSVQDYSVPLTESLRYEFLEFSKRPRTLGEEKDAVYVDLPKERPLFRCKLGRASCVIDYTGKICPCMSFRHAGRELTSGTFDEVWESFSRYPEMKASPSYKCLSCEAYNYCDICPALMQFMYGDLEFVDEHFCKSAKARYQYYVSNRTINEILESI